MRTLLGCILYAVKMNKYKRGTCVYIRVGGDVP